MRRSALVAAVAIVVAASCSSDSPTPSGGGSTTSTTSLSPEVSALVGTWERETRCEELVAALTEAGLEQWVLESVAGNDFVPGVRSPGQIADPANPCDGAVTRVHAHFFDEEGRFGSLNWKNEVVDDGTYEIVEEGTFVISKEFPDVTFHYTIEGDTITFDPEIPECSPDCFEASWSVSVAYPGKPWRRVD